MKSNKNITWLLIGIIVLIGLTSCNPEKQLAIDFASKTNQKSILIISPDFLFKKSLKTYILDSIEHNRKDNEDSLLIVHSKYLNELNDSLFLANYVLGYAKSLTNFGFRVFNQNQAEQFLRIDSNTYQVNIAQIELEETLYTFRDEMNVYDQYFYHDHNLNAIYVNSWFEYSNTNEVATKQQVYFTTDLITDIPDGSFDYDIFSGKLRYSYNIDSLEVGSLYSFAYRIGSEYAKYTFDLLLNDELNKKIPPSERSDYYWRYNPMQNQFFPADDDRFIPLSD